MPSRTSASVAALAVWALGACSSSQGSHPGGPADGGWDGTPGEVDGAIAYDASDSATAADSPGTDGGTGTQDGAALDGPAPGQDGASGGDAADATADAPIDVGPPPVASCRQGATWGPGTALSVSTANDDFMGAVTPDELTIAWVTVNGSSVSVLYADRASTSSSFAAPSTMPTTTGYYASPKVALSPDGLRMIVVASDHTHFGVATRSSRSGAFGAAGGGEVDAINNNIAQGEAFFFLDDPVIGAHDQTFYYSLYGSGLMTTLVETTRADTSPWPSGVALSGSGGAFDAMGSQLRHPTGVAADDLTLFYWDDVGATEMVAWRPFTFQPFDHFETLGALKGAAPNASCDKLYYSAPGSAGGLDLFVATRM